MVSHTLSFYSVCLFLLFPIQFTTWIKLRKTYFLVTPNPVSLQEIRSRANYTRTALVSWAISCPPRDYPVAAITAVIAPSNRVGSLLHSNPLWTHNSPTYNQTHKRWKMIRRSNKPQEVRYGLGALNELSYRWIN